VEGLFLGLKLSNLLVIELVSTEYLNVKLLIFLFMISADIVVQLGSRQIHCTVKTCDHFSD